jgi:DNA-binding HxlR family transcriptional regulator
MTPTANGAPHTGKHRPQPQPRPDAPATTNQEATRVDPAILDLIRRPYLAEILTALDERPHTLASLRNETGAPRQAAAAALRALAAHHAITRQPASGSWDTSGDKHISYRLSPAGQALVQRLLHLDVWQALFDTGTHATPDQ